MGLRRIAISIHLVEKMLREGTVNAVPIDVPADVEIIDARFEWPDVIVVLARSEEFDGDDSGNVKTAIAFNPTFRRVTP